MQSILCFGDSNTWGLNPRDNSRFDDQTRWTRLLDDLLRPFGKRVIEEGLCGRTTQFHDWYRKNRCGLDAFPLLLESHSPLAGVVIMLGTNDCKTCFHASAEQIAGGVRQLVRQAKHAGVPEILVVSPIVLGHGVAQFDGEFNEDSVALSHRLKAAYASVAAEEGCRFLAASDVAFPSLEDREHMNEDGHRALSEAVFRQLLAAQKEAPLKGKLAAAG